MKARAALARLRRYVEVRTTAKPIAGLCDTVHGVHTGTEWEAEVRLSDLAAVVQSFVGGAYVHTTCGGAACIDRERIEVEVAY